MKKKYIGFAALIAMAGITLASCGQSSTKNSSTPTGNLNLNSVVATANNDYSIKNDLYYNRLRYNGNTIVNNKIREALYKDELDAITELFNSNDVTGLSEKTKNLLIPTKGNKKLFTLEGNELVSDAYERLGVTNNYGVLKTNLINSINGTISTSLFSTQDSDSIKTKDIDEINKSVTKYISSSARKGNIYTAADFDFTYPNDNSYFKIISFEKLHDNALSALVNPVLLNEAEKLSAQNALYQIADEQYIKEYNASADDDTKTKNSNYIYKETTIEDTFESSYQKFGTYHAVIIQFNSRKEAFDTVNNLTDSNNNPIDFYNLADLDAAKESYKALYNKYYEYKKVDSLDDEKFEYENNLYTNDFKNINDEIVTLIQTTLEDGDYLKEPRNINNKYVMAIRLDTTYEVSETDAEMNYSELNEEQKNIYDTRIKYNILTSNSSSYINTNFKSMIYERSNNDDKTDDIFIYDPFFEYKFYNSYSNDYVCIDKANFNNEDIFKIGDFEYKVTDFYNDASKEFSSSILTNYFELEYAYQFYDTYVDSDTHDSNLESLDTAITAFTSGNNSSYDKEIGLENYLLLSYGYTNKEDVMKYYFDAKTCLSSYLEKKVYEEWAIKSEDKYIVDENYKTSGILYNIWEKGNENYADLFSINLDHFLINIDDDGDGSPDDPKKFLANMTDEEKTDFENSVVNLARALYSEATNDYYKDNSLYKILTFIKSQYEEGAQLKSDPTKTWDSFKKYNFLITVEQLASNGDITQSSVSNFVTPFADYVKGIFKACVANNEKTSFDNGTFYIYNTETETGKILENADEITTSTLCETVYGYHVLVLNSYSKAKSTKYTKESDDTSGIQENIQLLIKEDEDDSANNIYITIDSYNVAENKVSFNQFFVYYIQRANGVESSLSSNISTLLSSMYDDVITTYTSNNFQSYLLLKTLDIKSDNETIQKTVSNETDYLANLVCDYDQTNKYYSWVSDNNINWDRPKAVESN